jgi:hypothetical protein
VVAARGLAVALATLALLAGPGAVPAWAEAGTVAVRDGRLTVKVEAMRADRVLAEIAGLTGIRISGSPGQMETLVTASFADVEIEAALARLLARFDHVLVFGPAPDAGLRGRQVLKEVRLFAAATRSATVPADAQPTAEVAVLLARMNDPDPAVRVASMEALGQSGADVPVDRVLAAGLADNDFRVRLAVLTSGLPLPRDVLFDHAIHDASPVVRAEALTQLPGNDPRAGIVVQAALADQDDDVRSVARVALAGLQARQAGR